MFNIQNDSIALISSNGEQLTYNQLSSEAKSLATFIDTRALVFCLCENSIGPLIAYVSCLNSKSVPLLLESAINPAALKQLLDAYAPCYICVPLRLKGDFACFSLEYEFYGYCLFKTNFKSRFKMHENLALLLTTSGSTGSPKLVRITYDNILHNANAICDYLKITQDERAITTLPMNYTYGLSIINSHLLCGATILLTTHSLMQKEFWAFLKAGQATSFGGVPYTYEILKRLRFFNMDTASLKTITQAGGKLAAEMHKEFAEFAKQSGKKFTVMYGQTEATARMSYLPFEKSLEKYGSIGIAIPGGVFSIIEPDENGVGELVYEGKNVTMGYAECGDDLIKGDEWQGRLATGDIARCDSDGYYYIVGRKKRFLKLFSNRVNLDELQQLIKKEFAVDCAVTGVDDNMKIYITDAALRDTVKRFLIQLTGINKAAFQVNVIDEIPKNEAGKTLYVNL